MEYQKKTDFELFFPIINNVKENLFESDKAYDKIKRRFEKSNQLLKDIDIEEAYLVDFYANRFSILSEKSMQTILSDADWLLNYLKSGNTIASHPNFIQRIFTSKQLRKRYYIIDSIFFDGEPCNRPELLAILMENCNLILKIDAVTTIWNVNTIEFNLNVEKYKFLVKVTQYAKESLIAYEKGIMAVEALMDEQGLHQ
jgi:hypothetical protein